MSRVPGFRTGVLWKKILAGTFYGLASISLVSAATSPNTAKPSAPTQPVVETFTTKTQEAIDCEKKRVDDDSLDAGKEVVSQTCVNGTKEVTWEITKTNGQETAKQKKKEDVIKKPVPEITKVGTKQPTTQATETEKVKSCSDGYINTAGNCIRSPSYSVNGPPSGATAKCVDGTYSYSQSRRGTCSHHGGVASWL